MSQNRNQLNWIIGVGTYGALVVGIIACLGAIVNILRVDWTSAGICLVAAGLSFGLLANAVLP